MSNNAKYFPGEFAFAIRTMMDYAQVSVAETAKIAGVTPQTVRNSLNEKSQSLEVFLVLLDEMFTLNPPYARTVLDTVAEALINDNVRNTYKKTRTFHDIIDTDFGCIDTDSTFWFDDDDDDDDDEV